MRENKRRRRSTRRAPATGSDAVVPIDLFDLPVTNLLAIQRAYREAKKKGKRLISVLPLAWDVAGTSGRAGRPGKLTPEQLAEVKKLRKQNPKVYSQRRLAEKFGVSASAIARALRRPGK